MRKKRLLFICATCVLFAAACAAAGVIYAASAPAEGSGEPSAGFMSSERISRPEAYWRGLESAAADEDLWTRSYRRATPEQRQRLENIEKTYGGFGDRSEYTKQILTIMGDLPPDTPNLTMEQAREICETFDPGNGGTVDEAAIQYAREFSKIAGAPDFDGGSGVRSVVFYLDGDPTKCIVVVLGSVLYIDKTTDRVTVLCSVSEEGTN